MFNSSLNIKMGDKIEITTFPKQFNMFYRVSSNALAFEVKSPGYVGIGLCCQPLPPCNVWVGIGCANDITWIGKPYQNHKEIKTPKILSKDEYRSFLLTWHNDFVKLAAGGETRPLLSFQISTSDIMYVTFSIAEHGSEPAEWKFELPPLLDEPRPVSIEGGIPRWVPKTSKLPKGALLGGYENEPLYIMRAPHEHSLTPGKLVPSEGVGYLAWGGASHAKKDYEVLCGYNCVWEKSCSDKIPTGSFVAGRSESSQEILYLGRAEHNGHVIPGKVQPSHKVCYIPYEGREISKNQYEILVIPDDHIKCVNKVCSAQMRDIPHIVRDVERNVSNFPRYVEDDYLYDSGEDDSSGEE